MNYHKYEYKFKYQIAIVLIRRCVEYDMNGHEICRSMRDLARDAYHLFFMQNICFTLGGWNVFVPKDHCR